ncbi:MAG: hypothetical protein VW708_03130, partial [Ilumatobacter sp.]
MLAVDADEPLRLLDHAVGLRGDDEPILGDADEESLSAAPQCQQHAGRLGRCHRGDRHRAVELVHGAPEGLDGVVTLRETAGDERGDRFRVGRDLVVDAESVSNPEIGVVVDITVERCHHGGL